MRRPHFTLGAATVAIVAVWLLFQVVLIFCHFGPQGGDWGHYIALAHRCYDAGQWYPMGLDISRSNYIFAPGLVNLLILEARLTGGIWINKWLYLLMNMGLLLIVTDTARRLFSRRTACWTAIVYCLLYSNAFIALSANSELPFVFISMTGVWLVVATRKPYSAIAAGALMGLANWIRPLGVLYLVAAALFLLLFTTRRKAVAGIGSMLCGFILSVCVIGFSAKAKTGHFIFQSTTGGFNLIMTANDRAFGGVDTEAWHDSTSTAYIADIDHYDCLQRDSIWRARSLEWIREHPLRYAWLYVKKVPILLAEDSWTDQRVFGGEQFYYKYRHGEYTRAEFTRRIALKLTKSVPYYLMMVLAVIGAAALLRRRDKRAMWLTAVFAAGVIITCFFPVQPRYHYPFLWTAIILAAWWLADGRRKSGE